MKLTIVKWPEPVLQQPGEPVTDFDADLRTFVADMFETMYDAQGVGLAAPQVAVSTGGGAAHPWAVQPPAPMVGSMGSPSAPR